MVGSHIVELVHDGVEDGLGFGLFSYEIICIWDAVARLVPVAIVADECCQVLYLVASPWLREQRVELGFHRLFARIETEHALYVMRRIEEVVPCVGLPVHVLEIRIIRVELLDPAPVGDTSAVESGRRVEHILVVLRMVHEQTVVVHIPQLLGYEGGGVVVV